MSESIARKRAEEEAQKETEWKRVAAEAEAQQLGPEDSGTRVHILSTFSLDKPSCTRRHMLGHERPEAVSPARGVVLTDLQSSI